MVMGDIKSVEESSIDESVDNSNLEYFERGSEWRKWDLHLHSPSSFDYKGNPTNEEIIQTLKDNDISAAVITDHHYIDVDRINKLADLGKKENILILPGIELRSELGGSTKVHFTCVFPIEKISYIWTKIKGELNLQKEDIDEVGHDKIYRDLIESCNLFHELGGITIVHAGTKQNSIEKIKDNYAYKQKQKEDLVKNPINILELGKEENINFYENIVFQDIGFKVPLVIGSDNHNIKNYDPKYNCWIKADLTFEGLKQIIYEPEGRVRIQEMCPDEKNDYEVIDRVKFEDPRFTNYEILLNSNLVSIIGGRSTGKSIFLRSIARAIDKNQVDEKWDKIDPNAIVKWKDGKVDTFNGSSTEDDQKNKIKYIPQNFLNEQIEQKPDSFLNTLIKDILKSNENYKEIFSKITNHEIQFDTEIPIQISELFKTEDYLNDLKDQQKELGSPEAIKKQMESLKEKYDAFQIKEEVSDEDKQCQAKLIDDLKDLNEKITLIKGDNRLLNELLNYLNHEKSFLDKNIIKNIQNLSNETKNEISSFIFIVDTVYRNSLVDLVEGKIETNKNNIETIQKTIESKDKLLENLNSRINSSEQAREIFDKFQNENKRLSLITEKIDKINETEGKFEKILEGIFTIYNLFIQNLELDRMSFNFDSTEYSNFRAELLFKNKKFNNSLENLLNKHKFKKFEREFSLDLDEFKYNPETFIDDLELIIRAILDETLLTKKGKTRKDALKELLGIYHFINFTIYEDDDRLEEMSPGKRSFALLKVLIDNDNSKWPILIDQPEDDLDANSISKSLSKLLREKKKHRQIIIVSHNPNLVVGADSEQVIVANQHGSDSENKSKKFEYISGSIENTFEDKKETCYLYCKGIKDHICEILEGGEESFKKRQHKYNIK